MIKLQKATLRHRQLFLNKYLGVWNVHFHCIDLVLIH